MRNSNKQALLIVIGNPMVLETDKNWKELLGFCRDNKSYKGIPYIPVNDDFDEGKTNSSCIGLKF
jgi:superfamily I DNA and/or RNA helicase